MDYTQSYTDLKSLFRPDIDKIDISWSGVKIHNLKFRSRSVTDIFVSKTDKLIGENYTFTYPVFEPATPGKKVILLLHGLNERSWIKYLSWAHWLAENTGSYVILFPISFHINRSPEAWKDPRSMVPETKHRISLLGETSMLSFANVALSNRLTENPLRFFVSGHQTVLDLIDLLNDIRSGKHELIPGGAHPDIFAYSIGAFLAQILMLADPEKLFTDSRLFIFCGGSVFSNMNGTSKMIMDSYAFNKVYNFYLNDFEKNISGKSRLSEFLRSAALGLAFRSMIDLARLKSYRENILRRLRDQVKCCVLSNDTVIPAVGTIETLKATGRKDIVKVHDFPFACSHENPFPVFTDFHKSDVDRSFDTVFREAGYFFG